MLLDLYLRLLNRRSRIGVGTAALLSQPSLSEDVERLTAEIREESLAECRRLHLAWQRRVRVRYVLSARGLRDLVYSKFTSRQRHSRSLRHIIGRRRRSPAPPTAGDPDPAAIARDLEFTDSKAFGRRSFEGSFASKATNDRALHPWPGMWKARNRDNPRCHQT
jgi:hypothetical protein